MVLEVSLNRGQKFVRHRLVRGLLALHHVPIEAVHESIEGLPNQAVLVQAGFGALVRAKQNGFHRLGRADHDPTSVVTQRAVAVAVFVRVQALVHVLHQLPVRGFVGAYKGDPQAVCFVPHLKLVGVVLQGGGVGFQENLHPTSVEDAYFPDDREGGVARVHEGDVNEVGGGDLAFSSDRQDAVGGQGVEGHAFVHNRLHGGADGVQGNPRPAVRGVLRDVFKDRSGHSCGRVPVELCTLGAGDLGRVQKHGFHAWSGAGRVGVAVVVHAIVGSNLVAF